MAALTKTAKPLTWVITGSSSGFGLELTRQALAAGHKVIATSRNPNKTPDLVSEVTSQGGRWLQLDADDANCGQVVTDLEQAGTQIDVLVNCAGFAISGPAEAFTDDEVRRVMETDFFGPFRLMRAVVPFMRARRSGIVVNISSGAGLEARPTLSVYGAAKSALDNVSKTLAKEVAEFNVRLLLVWLGGFDTPMAQAVRLTQKPLDPDYKDTIVGKTMDAFGSGSLPVLGDHKKAVKAIYEVVVGEGIGEGKEKEVKMILGSDSAVRVSEVQKGYEHMMEVFGEICHNVGKD